LTDSLLSSVQKSGSARPIPVELWLKKDFRKALPGLPQVTRNWVQANGFSALSGEVCLIPGRDGKLARVFAGVSRQGDAFQYSRLAEKLPVGKYEIATPLSPVQADAAALGWMLSAYAFTRYKRKPTRKRVVLVWPSGSNGAFVSAVARGVALGRDLINTPAEDMGPEELSQATRELAAQHGGRFKEIVGERLLKENYPSIHAVGRASSRAPRLVDFVWGKASDPKVTLVGKGVCFDTGGLDLKPADNMKLMKKDMGGAATVLAVASAVMELGLPIRLRVLIPAVENSVSGNAIRPLDVLKTRKGLSVEVGNTDAEGRLILSDALTEADAERPELLIDIATLTGAARVALGTELPALFSTSDAAARELLSAGRRVDDPLWRMPLHRAYRRQLDSRVADINNIPNGPYGGAITAALFLREFVSERAVWMHIDSMAFNLESRPGRPYGGEVFAARALIEMLRTRYARSLLEDSPAGPSTTG
jgi:leucyl aminopeptidase